MAGFLNTGLSALLSNRSALDVTSNNIANVNTEGYSRRRAEFSERPPTLTAGGYIGNGVDTGTVRRIYDEFIAGSVNTATSNEARFSTLAGVADRINNLLADPTVGLSPALSSFFNAFEDAAGDPGSLQLREIALGEAEALSARFESMAGQIEALDDEIDSRIGGAVDDINALTAEIADLNLQLRASRGRPQQSPNALLDRRDLALNELATKVGITTVETADGDINVVTDSGISLVAGTEFTEFAAVPDPFDASRLAVALVNPGGPSSAGVRVDGGELGALLTARDELVDRSLAELGLTATAVALAFNDQQGRGVDLDGAQGSALFAIAAPQALASSANGGSATLTAAIESIGELTGDDYELRQSGAVLGVFRVSDGQPVTTTGTGTAADPLRFDGLSVVVAGTANDGDEFLLRPTAAAATSIGAALTDGTELAFALPVVASAAAANAGSGQIAVTNIDDPADPALLNAAVIEFTSATTYQVDGAGSFTYTSGEPLLVNGAELVISGAPASGDVFNVSANAGLSGDNRNALNLTELRTRGTLDNGTVGLTESYTRFVTRSGASTRTYNAGLEAQTALLDSARSAQQSVSGVDLDEEAANLLKFEQAYQAAAQLVSVANDLFEELLGAVR